MDPSIVPEESPQKKNFQKYRFLLLIFLFLIGIPLLAYFLGIPRHTEEKTFTLVESSPDDQISDFPVIGQPTFVFSKKLNVEEKDLAKYFTIEPSVEGKWKIEKNGKVVYLDAKSYEKNGLPKLLSYDTIYTVNVNNEMKATDGKTLSGNTTVTFQTQKDPSFLIRTDNKLLVTSPDETPKITFYQKNQIKEQLSASLFVTVEKTSRDDFLAYFSHKKDKDPFYVLPKKERVKVFAETLPTVISGSEYSQNANGTVTLPEKLPSGIYAVTLQYPHRGWGEETFFIVSSKHIHHIVHDSEQLSVWTTDGTTGKVIPNASVELFSTIDTAKSLVKGTTDAKGIFTTKSVTAIDFAISNVLDDIAISKVFPIKETSNAYAVFSYTDRPVYRPGDTVHYKAVVRLRDKGKYSIPKGKLYFRLAKDYSWKETEKDQNYQELSIDENGSVTTDITLPVQIANLYPSAVLAIKQDDIYKEIDTLYLTIESYRKPDMEITVTTNDKEYISKDTATLTVTAKTLYGSPLINTPFSYRVLAQDYTEIKNRSQEYIIEEASPYYGYGKELTLGSGLFDEKGKGTISFSTDLLGFEQSQIITLEITPEIGAAPSTGKIAKLIHRGTFAIFFNSRETNVEDGITGDIVVLDHNNPRQKVSDQQLTLLLYKTPNYSDKTELIKEEKVTTDKDGKASFSFDTLTQGSYKIVAFGDDTRGNTITSQSFIYVAAKKDEKATPTTKDPFTITLDKKIYAPGETAILTLNADFPLQDVLQVISSAEKDGSYFERNAQIASVTTVSASFTLQIPLASDQSHPQGIDIFATYNQKAYSAHADIYVKNDNKKLSVKVTFDKPVVTAGETIRAEITTKDHDDKPVSADVSFSLIDKALLQIGEISGDIFDSFYGNLPTSYVTSTNSTEGVSIFEGGGGGGCFLAGTKIRMGDGTEKNIEDIVVGDTILTRQSDASNILTNDTVTKTFYHVVSHYLTINNTLHITPIHRIFVNGTWKMASDITIGDTLLTENNEFIVVESIKPHYGNFPVYNLATKEKHTFFAQGFYVHNEKGMDPRKEFADTAYWSPHIKTDKEGKANVTLKLPDNLTTFTAHAVAQTNDSLFGHDIAELISKKDFTIIPVLPPFAYQKEKSYPSFLLHNDSNNPVNATLQFLAKDLGVKENKTVHIPSHDVVNVTFPVLIDTTKNTLTYQLEAKDEKGKTLDLVELTNPTIPKGDIVSTWESFTGKKEVTFSPNVANLDFHRLFVSVDPHAAHSLFNSKFSGYSQTSSILGQELYAWSYILEQTKEGAIDPTWYKYAESKNNFRFAVEKVLMRRVLQQMPNKDSFGTYWPSEYNYNSDSPTSITLWIALSLQEIVNRHLLDELAPEFQKVIQQSKNYLHEMYPSSFSKNSTLTASFSPLDEVLFQWLTKDTKKPPLVLYDIEQDAVLALLGNKEALQTLKTKTLPSADDRMIWANTNSLTSILPVLAFVEKGTKEDADKAIKGMSIAKSSLTPDALTLLTSVKHAVKQNLFSKEIVLRVLVNKKTIFEREKVTENVFMSFSENFVTSNQPSGKITLEVSPQGALPFYTTIVTTTYNTAQTEEKPFYAPLFKFMEPKQAKVIEGAVHRVYRLLPNGETVKTIPVGKSAAVALLVDNRVIFNNHQNPTGGVGYLQAIDAVNPSGMILNQTSNNSPEYQSNLKNIFPNTNPKNNYVSPYYLPQSYSDQIVSFSAGTQENQAKTVLTYVVFQINQAFLTHPKTSIVFPILGIIATEK